MTTTSTTAVCNMALRLCGVTRTIASLTDDTEEARACSAFYEVARDEVLAAYRWPFARRAGALDLVAEQPETSAADDSYQWGYSYRAPSASAYLFGVVRSPASRVTTAATAVKYLMASDATGALVYADEPDAYGEWYEAVEDVSQWPAPFVMAVAALLGSYVAPGLKIEEPNAVVTRLYALYERKLAEAKLLVASQGSPDLPPESDLITARA